MNVVPKEVFSMLLVFILCISFTSCYSPNDLSSDTKTLEKSNDSYYNGSSNMQSNSSTKNTTNSTTHSTIQSIINSSITTKNIIASTSNPTLNEFNKANPLKDVSIKSISLKIKKSNDMFSSNVLDVKTINDARKIQDIQNKLISVNWHYYPNESEWVKCWPIYAKRILLFELDNDKIVVMHILYDNEGYVSIGTFDKGQDYQSIFDSSKEDYKKGISHFNRYKINTSTVEKICQLF